MTIPKPMAALSVDASVDAIQRLSIVPMVLETVCKITGMRFSAIARVTNDRWTACAVLDHLNFGLQPGGDLVLDSTICDEIRQHQQPVIFGHASQHPIFSTHHTPRIYGLESYVSIPILTADGEFFGTLCAIDSEPRIFDENLLISTLTLFASLIALNLALQDRARFAEKALKTEIDEGVLREQFLAVVGHDLRSPLQGARLIAEQLGDLQPTARGQRLVGLLSESIRRMAGLIDDIMDLARGRLGGGLPLACRERDDLQAVLEAAVEEVRQGQPQCIIVVEGTLIGSVAFDGDRMRQLLSNLLNNAVVHGDPTQPIRVLCACDAQAIDIHVSNQGTPIPEHVLPRLFEPFVRPTSHKPHPGLGLGLYIASEIAKGHAALLTATSSIEAGTTFTLRMPNARVID